jgi:hypothetical protein
MAGIDVTFKSGSGTSGGANASGDLILQTGENYGSTTNNIIFKTRAYGADNNTAGVLAEVLTLDREKKAAFTGAVSVAGTLTLGGTNITSTAVELNVLDGDTSNSSTTVASGGGVVYNDSGGMMQVDVDEFDNYFSGTTKTLTNKTLTAPKIANGGFIADANGNEQLVFTTTASAINHFSITNAASGNSPSFNATGDDSDVGITFTTKGSGAVTISGAELDVESYAAIGNGSALSANSGLIIDYDKTYTGQGQQLLVKGAVTGAANTSFYGASIEPESCTVPSGTTSVVASLRVKEPVITATGTLSTAATVYIEDAPTEGGNNYALLVDAGATRLDGDVSLGNDLSLTSDEAVLKFGTDSEITLTHVHNEGLALKHTSSVDSTPIKLTLQTSEGAISGGDVLGQIDFQATGEESGSDAHLVAAGIAAVSEGTFAADNNATKLSFKTAATETASEKMSLSSGGNLTVSGDVITSGLSDANGNEQLVFTTTASDINHFSITNDSSSNKPILAAVGDNNDIDLGLTPKGTGNVDITTGGLSIYHSDAPATGKIYIGGNFTTSFATNATSGYIIDVVANTVTDGATAADGTRNEFFGTRLAKPTISSTNTNVSVTKGATLYIADAPGTNSNVSFGTNSALHIDGGGMFVQGPSTLTGSLTVEGNLGITATGGSGITTTGSSGFTSGATHSVTGKLTLLSGGSTNATIISANTNVTAAAIYYLPAADGSANQVLKTDGSGNLSWVAQGSGGTIDGLSDAKKAGANFGGSLLIGRTNTGTLSNSLNNIGIGFSSVNATSGPFRVLSSGKKNVAIGAGDCANSLTTGLENTIIGFDAGSSITTQSSNVIIGSSSGGSVATKNSTIVGFYAGVGVTTGTNNTLIGSKSGNNITEGVNNTVIGYNATASSATANNEITLGNGSITELRCADTTITSLSDARDKTDVIDLPWGLDFVDSLRPVQFTWDRRILTPEDENWAMNGKKRAGFLAQELQTSMTDNANDVLDLVYESNPERLEVKMGKLVPMLTQAIKELKAEVDTLKAEVAALKNAI